MSRPRRRGCKWDGTRRAPQYRRKETSAIDDDLITFCQHTLEFIFSTRRTYPFHDVDTLIAPYEVWPEQTFFNI